MISQFKHVLTILLISVLLSSCTTTKTVIEVSPPLTQNIEQRNQQLTSLNKWKLTGKIAFLQGKNRDSVSINWQRNGNNQQLNLSTILGINVLKLRSSNGLHTINVDGKKYRSHDLETLIHSLTQFTLPTNALSFWLKGLPYQSSDTIEYHSKTHLPLKLNSQYDNRQWQIKYSNYVNIKNKYINSQLATKITISQADLTIKIAINNWTI